MEFRRTSGGTPFCTRMADSYAAVRLYGNSSYHTEKAGNFLNRSVLVVLAKLRRGML
jgi:hypothetical protein